MHQLRVHRKPNFRELWIGEVPRILLPRTWVNSPQPTPRSGGYSQRPEVFSEKFRFLLSLWAGR
jgi:hypothetical protein